MSTAADHELDTEGAERRLSHARYPNVMRAVFETPWAILPATMRAIVEVVELRVSGERLTEDQIAERIGAGPASRQPARSGAIQVIPIYGVIMPRATLFSQISGGTSLTQFAQQLQAAVDDPQIGSILLDIDSPGGSSALVQETAALIRAANQRKPVTAVANTLAASAAYWLGSQAGDFYVTQSGFVGSIGVYLAHEDVSGLEEKMGVKTTLISAGKYKVEGNEYEPLGEEARAYLQSIVNENYAAFVADVAKGRGISVADVRDGFGEGRLVTAKAAAREGMVDGVASFDQVVARMARGGSPRGARAEVGQWHYVGVDGEPAFQNGAHNSAQTRDATAMTFAGEPADELAGRAAGEEAQPEAAASIGQLDGDPLFECL